MNEKTTLILKFLEDRLGGPLDISALRPVAGIEAATALWPLHELFQPHVYRIKTISYDAHLEEEADAAIERYVSDPRPEAWDDLPPGVWRVLLERFNQVMKLTTDKENADIMWTVLPLGLDEPARLGALMLLSLHQMTLHSPLADRTDLETALAAVPESIWPH